ncbi:glycosyltransferase [Arthrobacter crystallopoietes]|uniref:glycosyltransferase family 2 protein n=1 Tax=Crystallibacter crystallopoietes TaxID=37928 RepID=UPI003D77A1B1
MDTGSTDTSVSLLEQTLPAGSPVVKTSARAGFGTAVRVALDELKNQKNGDGVPASVAPAVSVSVPSPASGQADELAEASRPAATGRGDSRAAAGTAGGATTRPTASGATAPAAMAAAGGRVQEWVWLLHDDSAPEPDALEELLLAVETAPSVTIAGCKQVDWENPRKLIDVGLTVTRGAERLTMIDLDEMDQGQYNGRSDFFAVNSAGMLIRRDAFEELGGFDPALPGIGDDVDLCWRNRLAGNRVVVVPTATMRHATSRGNPHAAAMAARRSQIHLRLKHAAWWQLPLLWIGTLLGGFFSFIISTVAKDPGHGLRQLLATLSALFRPREFLQARKQAGATRRSSRSIIKPLMVKRQDVFAYRRSLMESVSAEHVLGDGTGTDTIGSYEPTGGSDEFASMASPLRTWVGTGAVVATLVLALVSIIGMFGFLGVPALAGGALLPVSADLAEIWHNASAWWISLGSGMPGHGDPFGYVLAVLAILALGNGSAAVLTLILLAMPLAGLAAWVAAGAFTQRRSLRLWAAFFWASLPVLQVALGSGRLGALIAHLMIPWAVLGLVRATGSAVQRLNPDPLKPRPEVIHKPGINGIPSWTAAAAAGLCLAVITASAPALLPVFIIFVGIICLKRGRRAKTVWWSLVPPLVLALPMLLTAMDNPRALLGDPGVPLSFDGAPLWQQIMGFPVAFDTFAGLSALGFLESLGQGPWALVFALLTGVPMLVLAAVGVLLPGSSAGVARLSWLGAIVTLAASWVSAMIATAIAPGAMVPPFTGPFVSLALFLLLAAALVGGDSGMQRLHTLNEPRKERKGAFRAIAVAAVVVLAAGPVLNLAHWLLPQLIAEETVAAEGRALTDFGAEMQLEPGQARILPATATDRGTGPERTRSLVLSSESGSISAAVMHSGGTTMDQLSPIYAARSITGGLFDAERREDDDATAAARNAVAVIAAGTGVDPREELARLGVGFVVLQQTDSSAELLANRIDAVPGLSAVGRTDSGWLWRVVPDRSGEDDTSSTLTSRVRVIDSTGALLQTVPSSWTSAGTTIPEGNAGRMVVLAERMNPGWTATLNGQPLEQAENGWAQAFKVPETGGELRISYTNPWGIWVAIVQIIFLGITVLLAIPIPSRQRFVPRRVDHIRTTGTDSSPEELRIAAHEIDRADSHHADAAPATAGKEP